jgi:hypothetical protein
VPSESLAAFQDLLPRYLQEAQAANSEAGKALAFLVFVRQAFAEIKADHPGALIPELERYVHVQAGTVMVRGALDALLGNVVIEFKVILDNHRLKMAQDQLRRYVAALWALDGQRTNYMLMATDGVRFRVYRPGAPLRDEAVSPDDIALEEVNLMDLAEAGAEEAFRWLDRYVLWRERIPPRTRDMAQNFGVASPAFVAAMDGLRRAFEKGRTEAAAPFLEWSKYLSVVYGSEVGDQDLFLKHTYLATLAKLMVYSYYSSGAIPSREEVRKVLRGEAFREWGIENFLEEDFFSWLVRGDAEDEGLDLAWKLLDVLQHYDLSKLTEDVLKGLYQELVDPAARHDLGEYYTPDWLAEWIVERLLEDPKKTALDPACGSGTFLAAAARKKVQSLKMEPHLLLKHILASVKGIDVHPLAVLISKANYLMALGDLVKFKAGTIHVPVYLANSIDFPRAQRDVEHGVEVYRYPVSDRVSLSIPREAVDLGIVGELVEATADFARLLTNETVKPHSALFGKFLRREVLGSEKLREGARDALLETATTLASLIRAHKDTIYAFVVKNVYRPATIGRFDTVMGNPPWLSYRYVRLPEYQRKLKKMILREHKLLPPKTTELLTHMELATLFFARSAFYYLREGGQIAFVMPRAVFVADQHDEFRRGNFLPRMGFTEVVDLEDVSPLFNVPSAVIFAEKGGESGFPLSTIKMRGTLPERNAKLGEIEPLRSRGKFDIERAELRLAALGGRTAWAYAGEGACGGRPLRPGPSPYFESFRIGATMYPRQFWWVEIVPHPRFGIDPVRPFVQTSPRALKMAKGAYKNLKFSGSVESQYLYGGLLGSDLLPFAHLPPRAVVLPVVAREGSYTIVKREAIEQRGHRGVSRWLSAVEREWETRRGAKAAKFDIYAWLDWGGKLTFQSRESSWAVVYNVSGTYLAACVLKLGEKPTIMANGRTLHLNGLVLDYTTIYCRCQTAGEAHFLAAILNSGVIDSLVKPMQAKGLWGERHLVKKPLEIGIPKFNPNERTHRELVSLAESCAVRAKEVLSEFVQTRSGKVDTLSPQAVGRLRSEVRGVLTAELGRTDELVCEILVE